MAVGNDQFLADANDGVIRDLVRRGDQGEQVRILRSIEGPHRWPGTSSPSHRLFPSRRRGAWAFN